MATEEIQVDETELATQLRTRGLVRTVADQEPWRRDDNYFALIQTLATILNATDAPQIDLHIEEALAELEGPHFFRVQHVLRDLIPLLNVDQDVLLAFVARLVDEGGSDLAAGAPSDAFGEWTKKDPTRPSKVYDAARTGEKLALRQLSTVLRMNADADQALMFARAHELEPKLAAISALGAMELGERYGEVLARCSKERPARMKTPHSGLSKRATALLHCEKHPHQPVSTKNSNGSFRREVRSRFTWRRTFWGLTGRASQRTP